MTHIRRSIVMVVTVLMVLSLLLLWAIVSNQSICSAGANCGAVMEYKVWDTSSSTIGPSSVGTVSSRAAPADVPLPITEDQVK